MSEQFVEQIKDDMEYEALDILRELRDYAIESNVEPYFVIEQFIQNIHKYKDTDIDEEFRKKIFD